MHVKFLETLDWSILIAYFLILIAIGIWASSKRKKGSSLFLAENSLRWYHIGFSMWGTNVGPSMLIASASAGFTTGIVSGNYAWYAFVFICLLAFVFAPRYLGSRITTLPEFMGKRFGQSLYILPGIICLALFPQLENPDEAYMTMVTHLFPTGMVGLVLAVLTAALVSTVGSALNALSTVFTMDIYVKKIRPQAKQKEIIRVGQVVTVVGALISVIITIAIDSIKGLNLFNVFQSVLGFIAPPMAAVFLFGVFWKRTTTLAANMALTLGTVFSIGVGILYLWVFPAEQYNAWPHFMLLSFYLFVIIGISMVVVSLWDKSPQLGTLNMEKIEDKPARIVLILWGLLIVSMIGLYIFFNGH
ncbi:Na+/glucose cotransporter [Bacteroides ovatus]|nr:Na+/glucose cotransporter [Bacteroides ovatus]